MGSWKTLKSTVVFDTPWIRVRHDDVVTPHGHPGQYGVVEFKNRAVGVVPILGDGRIVMVRQSRYAIGASSLEIPEGGSPRGEDMLDTARRELQEETGYLAGSIKVLVPKIHLSNSVTNEYGALFVATQLTPTGVQELDDSEDISVELHKFDDLLAMIDAGELTDSLTIMALLTLARHRSDYQL